MTDHRETARKIAEDARGYALCPRPGESAYWIFKKTEAECADDIETALAAAVDARTREIVAIIDWYAQPERFQPSESWREEMTVSGVYGTAVSDVCGWLRDEFARGVADPVAAERVAFLQGKDAGRAECKTVVRGHVSDAIAKRICGAIDAIAARKGK